MKILKKKQIVDLTKIKRFTLKRKLSVNRSIREIRKDLFLDMFKISHNQLSNLEYIQILDRKRFTIRIGDITDTYFKSIEELVAEAARFISFKEENLEDLSSFLCYDNNDSGGIVQKCKNRLDFKWDYSAFLSSFFHLLLNASPNVVPTGKEYVASRNYGEGYGYGDSLELIPKDEFIAGLEIFS